MPKTVLRVSALLWSLCLVAGGPAAQDYSSGSREASAHPPGVDTRSMGAVAVVGHVRIGADQVFELWTPVWSETLAKVRNGKMSPGEGDKRLQREWERAILALVKDEVFYMEAEREHSSYVNKIIDMVARSTGATRNQAAADVRRMMDDNLQKYYREISAKAVRESGGMLKLSKVLEGRELSFAEWQNRLKKKAFTQNYLHETLSPRAPNPGPRQIQRYYQDNLEEYSLPGTVKFQHIFFSNADRGEEAAREDAIELWEQIAEGAISFEDAAARYSDDKPSKARGGLETEAESADLEREAWLSDIRTALREEPPGQLAPILESPFGCHVARLISIGPSQKIPFSEVRRDIEAKLQAKVWDDATDEYFASIRRGTPIQIVERTFPSFLSCSAQERLPKGGPRVYSTSRPGISAGRGRR